jgi:hypothetical protein
MAYQITRVFPAPRNTIMSASTEAFRVSADEGVYTFADYNDVTHCESVYVTDAPSEEAYNQALCQRA